MKRVHIHSFITRVLTILGLLSVCFPSAAQASVLSSIENFIHPAPVTVLGHIDNSQTIPLLDAGTPPTIQVKGVVVDESSLATIPEDLSIEKQVPLISTYTVRSGDSLGSIANAFHVSVNTILWSNGLSKKDVIKPGQNLIILPVSGVSHAVQKGDTIASLAKKYNADTDEIKNFNGIFSDSDLVVGEIVIIPDGEIASVVTGGIAKPKLLTKGGLPGLIVGDYSKDPQGYFMRPIKGGVRTQGLHGFNGVDLASSFGASIYAAADGTVMIAKTGGWNGGYGNYVVIQHPNGMQTLYGHLSSVDVEAGETVSQGDVVGKMGATGKATGVHLHFEVRGGKNPF